jgi:hypothetical protein
MRSTSGVSLAGVVMGSFDPVYESKGQFAFAFGGRRRADRVPVAET